MKNISSATSYLSRFLAKTLRIIKAAMKSFSKICRSETTLNCRSRHSRIKLTHTTCVVEKVGRNPDWRIVMANYVCTYLCMILTFFIFIISYFLELQTLHMSQNLINFFFIFVYKDLKIVATTFSFQKTIVLLGHFFVEHNSFHSGKLTQWVPHLIEMLSVFKEIIFITTILISI